MPDKPHGFIIYKPARKPYEIEIIATDEYAERIVALRHQEGTEIKASRRQLPEVHFETCRKFLLSLGKVLNEGDPLSLAHKLGTIFAPGKRD